MEEGSAKPLFMGSNPIVASTFTLRRRVLAGLVTVRKQNVQQTLPNEAGQQGHEERDRE
jgi:hypothetical protein